MKVIKSGTPWSLNMKCTGQGNEHKGCGAKLLVEQQDIFITSSHYRDESTHYATFECMECKARTDICEASLLNRYIQNA